MSTKYNLQKLSFTPLLSDGSNYLTWSAELKLFLQSKELEAFILPKDTVLDADLTLLVANKAKSATATLTLLQHLSPELKMQYINAKVPRDIWDSITTRFGDMKKVLGPAAMSDWNNLRFQDFPTVASYVTELYNITERMTLCGYESLVSDSLQISKTLTTFAPEHSSLATQYLTMKFTTLNDLLTQLYTAEVNQILLVKNSNKRPVGARDPPREANFANGARSFKPQHHTTFKKKPFHKQPLKIGSNSAPCGKCGTKGHFAAVCRTPSHLTRLYEDSKNRKFENRPRETYATALFPVPSPADEFLAGLHNEFSSYYTFKDATPYDQSSECVLDCGTTHTILNNDEYFTLMIAEESTVCTIGSSTQSTGHGPAVIILNNGTRICIKDAIYMPSARRNLLSFGDLKDSGYEIETCSDDFRDTITIRNRHGEVFETFDKILNGLYTNNIRSASANFIEADNTPSKKSVFTLWHARLGHPGNTMIRRMIEKVTDLPLTTKHVINDHTCVPCIQGKFQVAPSANTTVYKLPEFLSRLHVDVCGPIDPPCGPFRYFQVLADASGKIEVTKLLSTKNHVFSRVLTQLIQLKSQFPDFPIRTLRCDNASEYSSATFERYCESAGIELTYSTPYVHTQNGIAEAAIKKLQTISRPMLLQSNLPSACWGHAILHGSYLLKLRPSAYHDITPHQLLTGFVPSAKHLRIFGCAVYVPVAPPHRKIMGSQRQLGIYVGCVSAAIVSYLDPTTGNLHKARFMDCRFDESLFPFLGKDIDNRPLKFHDSTAASLTTDPRTSTAEQDVQQIITLQQIASKIPDGFADAAGVTKSIGLSQSGAVNAPSRTQTNSIPASQQAPPNKRGRPPGSKNKVKFAKSTYYH